jgi:hypothetical protein
LSSDEARQRAEKCFKQQERALDGRNAMNEYEVQARATRERTARLKALPINGKIVLRPPKAQSGEPAQTPARETPRRDTNRDRRKDK